MIAAAGQIPQNLKQGVQAINGYTPSSALGRTALVTLKSALIPGYPLMMLASNKKMAVNQSIKQKIALLTGSSFLINASTLGTIALSIAVFKFGISLPFVREIFLGLISLFALGVFLTFVLCCANKTKKIETKTHIIFTPKQDPAQGKSEVDKLKKKLLDKTNVEDQKTGNSFTTSSTIASRNTYQPALKPNDDLIFRLNFPPRHTQSTVKPQKLPGKRDDEILPDEWEAWGIDYTKIDEEQNKEALARIQAEGIAEEKNRSLGINLRNRFYSRILDSTNPRLQIPKHVYEEQNNLNETKISEVK